MRRFPGYLRVWLAGILLPLLSVQPALGWGRDGHEMINRLAGSSLPADVPEFLRTKTGLDALEFYGPVPDLEWRSADVPELNAIAAADHFIFLEYADLIGHPLPRLRYDFVRALAAAQAAHPKIAMTPEKIGMQPYAVEEGYERLEAAMRDYRGLAQAKQDTRAVEAEIVYAAGILGHFVGDGSNPMHASIEYGGWVGPNPHGYTTDHGVHWSFENDFVHANVKASDVKTQVVVAKPTVLGDVFEDYVKYLRHSNSLVEKTYQLQKAGGFAGAGTPAGKAFVEERLAAGAIELRDIIYTAWVKSGDPVPA